MLSRAQKIRLGAFIMVGSLLLLMILIAIVGNRLVDKKDTYYISFENYSVSGLQVGGTVNYSGIKVGRVENIKIDPKDVTKVIITISVDRGTPIKVDTQATLAYMGITGIKAVELTGGTNQAARLKPKSFIKTGSSMIDDISDRALSIADKIDIIAANIGSLTDEENRRNIADILSQTSMLLNDTRENLSTTMISLNQVATNTARLTDGLNDSISRITDTFVDNVNQLTQTSSGSISELSQSTQSNLTRLTDSATTGISDLSESTQSNLTRLTDSATTSISGVTDNVNRVMSRMSDDVSSKLDLLTRSATGSLDSISMATTGSLRALTLSTSSSLNAITKSTTSNLDSLGYTTKASIERLVTQLSSELDLVSGSLDRSINEISASANQLLADTRIQLNEVGSNSNQMILSTTRQIAELSAQINRSLLRVNGIMESPELASIITNLNVLSGQLSQANLKDLVVELTTTLNRASTAIATIDRTLLRNRANINETLESLREASVNLNEFSRQIAEQPSTIIRGN
ncbi:MAG TPA: MlaD family protein [Candidatus Cloacimonadota bacterium]|nr:MlaD family protein [Candidatus Cloacimonadota bacterium]